MPDPSRLEIQTTSLTSPHGLLLSARQREEILQLVPDLPPFATDIPVFLVLLRDGEPLACGGLRPFAGEDDAAEIKRVYVVPEARGRAQGVADFLLARLEATAVERGWTTIRLQTGTEMTAANRFYARHGYRRMQGNYGEYVGAETTISFEKILR